MGEVVYRSRVTIEKAKGALRYAHIPAADGPVAFGVHGEVAEHYGAKADEVDPHATTLDYVVAAAGG